MKLGDAITKKLTSGRFYLKRKGETSYVDWGNVQEHKLEPEVGRADHMNSSGGVKRTDVSLVKSIKPKYVFVVDEHHPELQRLILLGNQGADVVYAGGNVTAEALTASNSKQGRTYFAAHQGLSAVVVKVGGVTKVLDTDYAVDLSNGAITILVGGGIADNSTVTVDYTAAAVTTQPFTSFDDLRVEGDIRYIEQDQFSKLPRQTTDFFGQIHVTNWGENNLEDFNKVALECLPLNKPTVSVRKD